MDLFFAKEMRGCFTGLIKAVITRFVELRCSIFR